MQEIKDIPVQKSKRRNVAYRIFGNPNSNLILVWHAGWFTSMKTTWLFLPAIRILAEEFGCIIYDRAGVGESKENPGRTIPDRALDVADVIRDCLGDREPQIKMVHIGISEGGSTALEFAARFRDYTDGLVLVGTTPKWISSGGWMHGLDPQKQRILEDHVVFDTSRPLNKRMEVWCDRMFRGSVDSTRFGLCLAEDIDSDETIMKEIYRALVTYDARHLLKSIQVPTLILHGQKDEIDVEGARAMSTSMECARLLVYPNCRHGVWWGKNETQFSDAVHGFIKSLADSNWDCPSTLPYVNVTAHPWRAKKDFQRSDKIIDPDLCAVMLPTKPKTYWNEVFECISQAASTNDMRTSRVIDMGSPGQIIEDAWGLISQASTVVADVSRMNVNVIYEVGVCDTWGKTVFLIADENTMDHPLPLYLRNRRLIPYKHSKVGLPKLINRMCNELRDNRKMRGIN